MKKKGYLDMNGQPINSEQNMRSTVKIIYFVFNVIFPLALCIVLGVQIYHNYVCQKTYNNILNASKKYANKEKLYPTINGNSVKIRISKLYENNYITNLATNKLRNDGTVKITKVDNKYIYTLDVKNCNYCSTGVRYKNWSSELDYNPVGKSVVDVIPYYNYTDREVNYTEWTDYLDPADISKTKSKYGIYLPKDKNLLPKIPSKSHIFTIEAEPKTYYNATITMWKWYNIVGEYSDFSSEQPNGYTDKDESTLIYTNWTSYSQNYPTEKNYREVKKADGYQWYYKTKNGQKVYYKNKQYVPESLVNTKKYNEKSDNYQTMYSYRDRQWRWYNGTKREYSVYSSTKPGGYSYKDDKLTYTKSTGWVDTTNINDSTKEYMTEKSYQVYRYRIQYEFLSDFILKEYIDQDTFIAKEKMSIEDFMKQEQYKLTIKYKYRYKF